MAKFYLDATKLKTTARAIDNIQSSIDKQYNSLASISLSDWGVTNEELKDLRDSLEELKKDISAESKATEDLSKTIAKIIDIYTKAEDELVNGKKADISNQKKSSSSPKKKKDLVDEIDDIVNQIPRPERDILMFLLGCIPGVNVLVDAYSLVSDYRKAMKDGKISPTEWLVLGTDLFCLAADTSGTFAAFKAIKKAKEAKAMAEATAKEAAAKATESEAAKKAADNTAKAAGRSSEKATEDAVKATESVKKARTAKRAGETGKSNKYYRRMVKDAEKTERDANRIAKLAENNEKIAQRDARSAADVAAADQAKKQYADKVAEAARKKVWETAKEQAKPDRKGVKRFVANEVVHLANDGPN